MKFYSLNLHWKQGDDFHGCMEHLPGDLPQALNLWATLHQNRAETCRKISEMITGFNISCEADTHMICFEPGDERAVAVLDELVKQNILDCDDEQDE